jgi:hypothetical protein
MKYQVSEKHKVGEHGLGGNKGDISDTQWSYILDWICLRQGASVFHMQQSSGSIFGSNESHVQLFSISQCNQNRPTYPVGTTIVFTQDYI